MKKLLSHLRKNRIIIFFLKVFSLLFLVFFLIFGFFFFESLWLFPNLKLSVKSKGTEPVYIFLDRNEIPIPNQTRSKIFTAYEELPEELVKTVVAVEDHRFFTHHGVDLISLIKCVFMLPFFIFSRKRPWGASTITQQLVRTLLLSNKYSYLRKIREIILSLRLETCLTKKQIFEGYINNIYFGRSNYDIASASMDYFNKSLSALNPEEIAFLIASIKNPGLCSSADDNFVLNHRNHVLLKMHQNNLISQEEYLRLKENPPVFRRFFDLENSRWGQHFLDYVKNKTNNIIKKVKPDFTKHETFIVRTTLDQRIQKVVERTVKHCITQLTAKLNQWYGTISRIPDYRLQQLNDKEKIELLRKYKGQEDKSRGIFLTLLLSKKTNTCLLLNGEKINISRDKFYDKYIEKGDIFLIKKNKKGSYMAYQSPKLHCSLVIVDGKGNILSMLGSSSYQLSHYNRVIKTKMQMASIMKILDLVFLMEEGFALNSMVEDAPVVISRKNYADWKPKNWDRKFWGKITLAKAVQFSRNCPLVKTIVEDQEVFKKYETFCKTRLGLKEVFPATVIGSNELSMMEIIKIFVPLCNGGISHKLKVMKSITEAGDGHSIYENKDYSKSRAFDSIAIYQTYKTLINSKTINHYLRLPRKMAAKSGTANNQTRGSFVAYSKDFVIMCSVAFDNNQATGLMGARGAGLIIESIMKGLEKERLIKCESLQKPKNMETFFIDRETGEEIQEDSVKKAESSGRVVVKMYRKSTSSQYEEQEEVSQEDLSSKDPSALEIELDQEDSFNLEEEENEESNSEFEQKNNWTEPANTETGSEIRGDELSDSSDEGDNEATF